METSVKVLFDANFAKTHESVKYIGDFFAGDVKNVNVIHSSSEKILRSNTALL